MSKTKRNFSFRYEDRKYYDGEETTISKLKSEKSKNRMKRIQQAIKTKNVDRLLEIDNEGIDPIDYEHNLEDSIEHMKVQWK